MTIRSAIISPCGKYRYRLERVWDADKAKVGFIMLNPSTADAETDDPTIRRCTHFAKNWGYGGLIVGNLFAFRATDPSDLYKEIDPVGPLNAAHLTGIARDVDKIICAWGAHGSYRGQSGFFRSNYRDERLEALGLTKDGQPRHPLYISGQTRPRSFR